MRRCQRCVVATVLLVAAWRRRSPTPTPVEMRLPNGKARLLVATVMQSGCAEVAPELVGEAEECPWPRVPGGKARLPPGVPRASRFRPIEGWDHVAGLRADAV